MKIKVIYSEKVVAYSGSDISTSASKPIHFAKYLQKNQIVEFIEPNPVSREDIIRCHDEKYVDDILNLKRKNGFGNISKSVADSLPYTNGAMYTAAKRAYETKEPTCAIVSGFHHAGYNGFENLGYFCTFNGLMIAAMKLIALDGCKKVAIVDCDMHWGNGTDDIIDKLKISNVLNISFGRRFGTHSSSAIYLAYFNNVLSDLRLFNPDVIIYQSGADVHINDPFGGLLTEEEMYKRDIEMFSIAKGLNIPISWTLAGGYQKDLNYVLKLHANTFDACREIFNG